MTPSELGAANQRHVWELVRKAGLDGISRADLQRSAGMDHFTVARHLTTLKRTGAVALLGQGKGSKWVALVEPQRYEQRKRRRETAASWAQRWSEDKPLQRVVSAAQAPRIAKKARGLWDV